MVLEEKGYTTCGGIQLEKCNNCGDCMTGCNHSAKVSLDTSLLAKARRSAPGTLWLVTGATVLRLMRDNGCWQVLTVHTDKLAREHQGAPYVLSADKVILAAGSLGSTEILLRSRSSSVQLSARLGQQFSTNGDNVVAIYGMQDPVGARATAYDVAGQPGVGPTITGIIDTTLDGSAGGTQFLAEEFAIPGPLKTVFDELFTTTNLLARVPEPDNAVYDDDSVDPAAVNEGQLNSTMLLGINGHDPADGVLILKSTSCDDDTLGDGLVDVSWPSLKGEPLFSQQIKRVEAMLDQINDPREHDKRARILPNPLWRLLPEEFDELLGSKRGPILSVHPLGGCPMGEDAACGAVDAYGRVFDDSKACKSDSWSDRDSWFGSLVVLDGAIIPTSLGVNPSLTIATVARWAVQQLRDKEWKLTCADPIALVPRVQPIHGPVAAKAQPAKTAVVLRERLEGTLVRRTPGGAAQRIGVELTLRFEPVVLADLSSGKSCTIKLADRSQMRIYPDLDAWRKARMKDLSDQELGKVDHCEVSEIASGKIEMLGRAPGTEQPMARIAASLWPWWRNRGKRDIWQVLETQGALRPSARELAIDFAEFAVLLLRSRRDGAALERCQAGVAEIVAWRVPAVATLFKARLNNALALASRAGAHRVIKYELTTALGARICGVKTLGYGVASNPAMQLADLELTCFDGYTPLARAGVPEPGVPCLLGDSRWALLLSFLLWRYLSRPWRRLKDKLRGLWQRLRRALSGASAPVEVADDYWDDDRPEGTLRLDTRYLTRKQRALVRITQQADSPSAMADIASFFLYMARVLLPMHLWTFRQPDKGAAAPVHGVGNARLPGPLPGLAAPDIIELDVAAPMADGTPVRLRLTRYRKAAGSDGDCTPLLLIHGYSASGTTFAHPSIAHDLTRHFSKENRGRDVWILDMRTSCGMPTARWRWTMEEVGRADIPLAVAHIRVATGQAQVDVVAHCVGCAMFSIAVLSELVPGEQHVAARLALRESIRNVVLSQYGPVVVVTPDNTLRAFIMAHLRHYTNGAEYRFKPDVNAGVGEQVFDRLLAGLPLRRADFDAENPVDDDMRSAFRLSTPWTATRHRMDTLYGRTFNPENMDAATLASIDDFFGPMNMDTLAQMIHFAHYRSVTDRSGNMVLGLPESMPLRWTFPTLSLHSRQNGMIDIASMTLMQELFDGFSHHGYQASSFAKLGHQDCLIGTREATAPVFACIEQFFRAPPAARGAPAPARHAFMPAMGPMLKPVVTRMVDGAARRILPFCVAVSPVMPIPVMIVVLAKGMSKPLLEMDLPRTSKRPSWIHGEIDLDDVPAEILKAEVMLIHEVPQWMARVGSDPSILAYSTMRDDLAASVNEKEFAKCCIEFGAARHQGPASFFLASCQYSAGLLDEDIAMASFERMSKRMIGDEPGPPQPSSAAGAALPSAPPTFLLLVGDQIYADQTAGVFNPITRDDDDQRKYQLLYQRMYLRKVLSRVPAWRMLDDHEIADNWEPGRQADGGAAADHRKQIGVAKYLEFQRMMEPDSCGRRRRRRWRPRDVSFSMLRRLNGIDFPFFVADTRTARDCRYPVANSHDASIMNAAQARRLCEWLTRQQRDGGDIPKFVASPAMFLPRLRSSAGSAANPWDSQGWDGYPKSLQRVLAHILDGQIKNVAFLSGDAHLSCWATAELSRPAGPGRAAASNVICSIHSSGLYAPYPFANSRWEDFNREETFAFASVGGPATCTVHASPSHGSGDGFALITPYREAQGDWALRVEFDLGTPNDIHEVRWVAEPPPPRPRARGDL